MNSLNQPNFYQIAEKFVGLGAFVVPAEPGTKVCKLPDWQNRATRDLSQILQWSAQNPDYNVCIVGKPIEGALWGFDDDGGVLAEYESVHGKIETYRVRTVSGNTQLLFKANAASIAMGNLTAKDENGKELFSARIDNRYVISAGSRARPHNDPNQELVGYSAIDKTSPIEASDDFIAFLKERAANKVAIKAEVPSETIQQGGRNNFLTRELGRVHNTGVKMPELLAVGLRLNDDKCNPPLTETEVRTIAESIDRYKVPPAPGQLVFNNPSAQAPEVVLPEFKPVAYPKFPDPTWLFKGCSIYEGLAKPMCDMNPSRRPEFMMLPAMTVGLNFLGNKVHILDKNLSPSIFMVSIARKGRLFKSACVQDAINYLSDAKIVNYAHGGTTNPEGKSLVWTIGSTEGLGLEMDRTHAKNAILFFDELGTLSKKASYESSTLGQTLCTLYESGQFANTIKSRRERFSFQPQSYCASLIACTTDRNFISKMSPLISSADGIDERFFYLYQPEVLPEPVPYTHVNCVVGAMETKRRFEKAVLQGVYQITGDTTPLEHLAKSNNRAAIRAEKWALYFAIDTGSEEITDDHIERAVALSKYELAVKKFLAIPEAQTREGAIQSEVLLHLKRAGGKMSVRDLHKKIHPERLGTSLWSSVFFGLTKNGWVGEVGSGQKGDPKTVVLLRVPESEDDE